MSFNDSPADGGPVGKKASRQKEAIEILKLAGKTQSRAGKLALLGCVETVR